MCKTLTTHNSKKKKIVIIISKYNFAKIKIHLTENEKAT